MSHTPSALHILAPMREGGLERVVTMMSAGQRPSAVHVAAVLEPADAADHPFVARLAALDIAVTPIVVGARGYLREYRQLTALVTRLRPGVVHTHGYRADVIGGAVARTQRIPAVSTVHGFTGGDRRNRLYERLQVLALRRADAVLAVSDPLVHRLTEAGVPRERIHCVPNGYAPSGDLVTRSAARRRLGLSPDGTVIGWVGRLSREKGGDIMLDALAQCDSSWRLSMIGEGPELERLKQQAANLRIGDRVVWHGRVADAGTLFAAFDAFVLSSRTEGTPITLLEAMDSGVPIVATRVGGVPDVVTSSHASLVEPEEPKAIADALAELKRDPAAAVDRCKLARERLLQSFGSATWLQAVEAVYQAARRSAPSRGRR